MFCGPETVDVSRGEKSRAPSREHATFGPPKAANVFLNSNKINFTALNLPFSTKLIKYFKYFCIKFALSFRFFDSWYIIKYLLTETSGKQYVLWTLDCRCFPRLRLGKHRQSRVHKTYCFPRSQSISVKYQLIITFLPVIQIYTKFANFARLYFLHFTTFHSRTLQFY